MNLIQAYIYKCVAIIQLTCSQMHLKFNYAYAEKLKWFALKSENKHENNEIDNTCGYKGCYLQTCNYWPVKLLNSCLK